MPIATGVSCHRLRDETQGCRFRAYVRKGELRIDLKGKSQDNPPLRGQTTSAGRGASSKFERHDPSPNPQRRQ